MDRIKPWALPGAVLVAGLSVAVALLFGHRFTAISSENVLWVTDSLTGNVTQCRYPTAMTGGASGCLELRAPRTLTDAEVGLKPDLSAFSRPLPKTPPAGDEWRVVGEPQPITPEEKAKLDASEAMRAAEAAKK